MRDDDALDDEMRRPAWPRPADPLPLDRDAAERMLAGFVAPDDAPPGYSDVMRVLAAAAGPPTPEERSGEAAAVRAFRSAHRPADNPRRTYVFGKLLSAKVLVATIVGLASVGTAAAAATGSLPGQGKKASDRVLGHSAEAHPNSAGAIHPGNPPVALPGVVGLCRAWAAGQQGNDNGGRLDATAFKRLAAAAGGADKVPAFCRVIAAQKESETSSASDHPNAHESSKALLGSCHAWLDAMERGNAATLGKPVRDRLATAAGGADKVTAFCTALVAQESGSKRSDGQSSHPTPTQRGESGSRRTPPTPSPHS